MDRDPRLTEESTPNRAFIDRRARAAWRRRSQFPMGTLRDARPVVLVLWVYVAHAKLAQISRHNCTPSHFHNVKIPDYPHYPRLAYTVDIGGRKYFQIFFATLFLTAQFKHDLNYRCALNTSLRFL